MRTKYIDEVIMENEKSIKQIVLLGAGMDTRALRLPLGSDTTVFEVDQAHPVQDLDAAVRGQAHHSAIQGQELSCLCRSLFCRPVDHGVNV
ncbi:hypothetical protein SAMD00019534_027600 [Acytostelium subglobosum LB1]|uniref:hypothetical protein n=1 Tax=Acytostelium subglobosum LB1 TaxID=1410327 RepID=UPI000644B80B|nr:hypothetical protein SAMD00019534_027600 [Acytostelium subglobosum LB1]GAM19585.1 hypothetical protein SAMD00019534_027600 [Acytostelium subglobosum LB1]|eukprot:XP_012756347.1 hypothetical protein SAMD00019534_027600 [Acytostelium subglobosum LB1]